MATNIELAEAIRNDPSLLGIPHSKVDCQAAVEKALSLVGVKVNFRGSNDMWRNMVSVRYSINEYREAFGKLAPGLICFTLKNDGSEMRRGYHDEMGAAVHVGIILNDKTCFQSASRGTEIIDISRTTFNRVGRCKYIDYDTDIETPLIEKINRILELLRTAKERLEEIRNDA